MTTLLDKVTKYQKFATMGKILPNEYAENLLELNCVDPSQLTDEICYVAWSVPLLATQAMDAQIAKVLSPSYRFRDLHYGGPGPSEGVREQTRNEYEKRVIAFAARLQAFRVDSCHTEPPSNTMA